jgi:hypothetical protein
MATKTTGGSMYSGLLQTNQELAKAQELESNALSIGLEQGLKPLQGYLMGVANEKKERENQLKDDQRLAIDQMNMMADTSGLLGDYEPIVTGLAQTTKNTLNDIAKDESLSQYEKAAKYKDAVDKFNKQVSKYSSDQKIIAGVTGQYAKGAFSQAINMKGDDYIIGKALSSGNYKIQGDKYIIEGLKDSNVDTNRLKQLYLPENNATAEKYSSQFAALGMATDDMKKVESGSRTLAMSASNTRDAAEALATMGVDPSELYLDSNENRFKTNGEFDLVKMQEEIYKLGLDKAKLTFIAKTPPIIQPSTAELMAKDAKFIIQDAMASGNFSFLMSKNAKFAGQQIVDATFSNGKLSITTEDKEGFGVPALKTIDLNTTNGFKQVGEIILSQAPGSQSVKGESISLFNNSYNQPKESSSTQNTTTIPEVAINDSDYPKTFEGLSGIQANKKELKDIQNKIHPESKFAMTWPPVKVENYLKEENLRMTEKNIYKAYFDLGISTTTFKSRNDFNADLESNRDKNMTADAMFNIAMNKTSASTSSTQRRNFEYKGGNAKAAAAALGKPVQELTTKDFEIYKWIKFSGKTKADYDALVAAQSNKFN